MNNTHALPHGTNSMPVAVQILSTLLFAGFAIAVTIVALNVFWPAGLALAVVLGWRGGFAPGSGQSIDPAALSEAVKSLSPEATKRQSGNASFDRYRSEMMERLEEEQENFEDFLDRLRAAKDSTEFEQFMDDRAGRISVS
ncbi:DUF2852 domain-containing protein [Alteromonas sp. 5E99-2]|uniref:DUF2852 domain-containing protein n=1 Tax=Alteromonas sp. 5E99-2 TaxID=2817683 RepID=UPI001A98E42E|nr:DUF2852 domain-containing protein [Alteromonas sp. 5E99-2]MBO1257129.1 DUF2852 domain-containing protein [Alteromonas sp. 5E99-2]